MVAQYLIQVHSGYVESQSVASLSFFLTVEDEWTAQELAEELRDLVKAASDLFNQELSRQMERWKDYPNVYLYSPTTPRSYLQEMFEWDLNGMSEWDLFEDNGWSMSSPDSMPITRVVSFVAFDSFLETNDTEWELKSYPEHHISDTKLGS